MKIEDVRREEKNALILGTIACVLVFLACCIGTRPNIKLATEEDIAEACEEYRQSAYTFASEVTAEPTEVPTPEPYITLGTCRITAYCDCLACCGKSDGITASGTQATEGRTIAVDPDVIPYGTEVVINGHTYIAEDCGGAINGNDIDIFMESHDEALIHGIQYAEVLIHKN